MIRSPWILSFLFYIAILLTPWGVTAAHAQSQVTVPIHVRVAEDGTARMVFDWPSSVYYKMELNEFRFTLDFGRPFYPVLDDVWSKLGGYFKEIKAGPKKSSIIFELSRPINVEESRLGTAVVFTITEKKNVKRPSEQEEEFTENDLDLKKMMESDKSSLPVVSVRAGVHESYSRLVFDWPIPAGVTTDLKEDKLILSFNQKAKIDLSNIPYDRLQNVTAIDQRLGAGVDVTVSVPKGVGVKNFSLSSNRIVVDILNPSRVKETFIENYEKDIVLKEPEILDSLGRGAMEREDLDDHFNGQEDTRSHNFGGDTQIAEAARKLQDILGGYEDVNIITAPTAAKARPRPTPSLVEDETAKEELPTAGDEHGVLGAMTSRQLVEDMGFETREEAFQVYFDPQQPVSLVAYKRGDYFYVVVADQLRKNVQIVANPPKSPIGDFETLGLSKGTGFRFRLLGNAVNYYPVVRKKGTEWSIGFGQERPALNDLIPIEAQAEYPLGSRVLIRNNHVKEIMTFNDPVVGDVLTLIPLPEQDEYVTLSRHFPEFEILETAQGIVIRRIADGVVVAKDREGVVLRSGGLDLALSASKDFTISPPPTFSDTTRRMFDIPKWARGGPKTFLDDKADLLDAIRKTSDYDLKRSRSRLNLVKFFIASGLGAEASSVLTAMAQDDGLIAQHPEYRALQGMAWFLLGRADASWNALDTDDYVDEPDVQIFKAGAAALRGDWQNADDIFRINERLIKGYNEPLRTKFGLLMAEAAILTDDPDRALTVLNDFKKMQRTRHFYPAFHYLTAQVGLVQEKLREEEAEEHPEHAIEEAEAYHAGEYGLASAHGLEHSASRPSKEEDLETVSVDKALEILNDLVTGRDRKYSVLSRYQLAEYELTKKRATVPETINKLDSLIFAWRGDALERRILRRKAELQVNNGDYKEGFEGLRKVASMYDNPAEAREVTEYMRHVFVDAFLGDREKTLTPLKALAFYQEFKELSPVGPESDALTRALAEKLVEIDLLSSATDLLQWLVDQRLKGEEKFDVATRLAAIYLLNKDPDSALKALDVDVGLLPTPEQTVTRKVLRAKALAELDQLPAALGLLSGDKHPETLLLQADLAWQQQEWADAAGYLNDLLPDPKDIKTLDKELVRPLVQQAVAWALADQQEKTTALRDVWISKLPAGSDGDVFKLLTRPEAVSNSLDMVNIRSYLNEVNIFNSFLQNYKKPRKEDLEQKMGQDEPEQG